MEYLWIMGGFALFGYGLYRLYKPKKEIVESGWSDPYISPLPEGAENRIFLNNDVLPPSKEAVKTEVKSVKPVKKVKKSGAKKTSKKGTGKHPMRSPKKKKTPHER